MHVGIKHRCTDEPRIEREHPGLDADTALAWLTLHAGFGEPEAGGVGRALQGEGGAEALRVVGITAEQHQLQVGAPVVGLLPLLRLLGQPAAECCPQGELLHPAGALTLATAGVGQGLGLQIEVEVEPAGCWRWLGQN